MKFLHALEKLCLCVWGCKEKRASLSADGRSLNTHSNPFGRCARASGNNSRIVMQEPLSSLRIEDVTTGNEAIARCLQLASLAAKSDVPVVLLGETGTGKTLLAHAIHNSSARAGKPFIAFNASALSDTLIESVKKTGACLVVEEGYRRLGVGAEIGAMLMEQAFGYLDRPFRRLAIPDVPVASVKPLVDRVLPSVEDICAICRELAA